MGTESESRVEGFQGGEGVLRMFSPCNTSALICGSLRLTVRVDQGLRMGSVERGGQIVRGTSRLC